MSARVEVARLLDYDEDTGVFTWRAPRGGKAQAGSKAGSMDSKGHIQIKLHQRSYSAHRLAWFLMTGKWPVAEIDHINRVRDDNRWVNLREATRGENHVNSKRPNKGGENLTGVLRMGRRFQAHMSFREAGRKRRVHLGMFGTAEEAHEAYLKAARAHWGEFAP